MTLQGDFLASVAYLGPAGQAGLEQFWADLESGGIVEPLPYLANAVALSTGAATEAHMARLHGLGPSQVRWLATMAGKLVERAILEAAA